jgi:hypothetical protein
MAETTLTGEIVQVLIGRHPLLKTLKEKQDSPDGAYLLSSPVLAVRATLEGLEGDRHAGMTRRADARTPFYPRGIEIRNSRQVSLVSEEELAELADALGVPAIDPVWLGANLVTRAIPQLSRVPPGTRLFFPADATLVIADENHPCIFPGKAIQHHYPDVPRVGARFVKAAQRRRGLVAWVERPGMISTGDQVRIALHSPVPYPAPAGS